MTFLRNHKIEPVTLPKLELCAALLDARCKTVCQNNKELRYPYNFKLIVSDVTRLDYSFRLVKNSTQSVTVCVEIYFELLTVKGKSRIFSGKVVYLLIRKKKIKRVNVKTLNKNRNTKFIKCGKYMFSYKHN